MYPRSQTRRLCPLPLRTATPPFLTLTRIGRTQKLSPTFLSPLIKRRRRPRFLLPFQRRRKKKKQPSTTACQPRARPERLGAQSSRNSAAQPSGEERG